MFDGQSDYLMLETACIHLKRFSDCMGLDPVQVFEALISAQIINPEQASEMCQFFDYEDTDDQRQE